MPKFFVKSEQISEPYINIINDDVNHIKNVLRLNIGDLIQICNSDSGQNYSSIIEKIENSYIKCKINEILNSTSESNVYIHIFQGLPKADKMELIIQKCTELGANEITPVNMERSVVKINIKEEKKIKRWQKIAEAASKQSGRDKIIKVNNVLQFQYINQSINEFDAFIVTYENEKTINLKTELLKLRNIENPKIGILIGPEGGIDLKEIEYLSNTNAKIVTLGKRILRTETVALAVCSIIQYELERNN